MRTNISRPVLSLRADLIDAPHVQGFDSSWLITILDTDVSVPSGSKANQSEGVEGRGKNVRTQASPDDDIPNIVTVEARLF